MGATVPQRNELESALSGDDSFANSFAFSLPCQESDTLATKALVLGVFSPPVRPWDDLNECGVAPSEPCIYSVRIPPHCPDDDGFANLNRFRSGDHTYYVGFIMNEESNEPNHVAREREATVRDPHFPFDHEGPADISLDRPDAGQEVERNPTANPESVAYLDDAPVAPAPNIAQKPLATCTPIDPVLQPKCPSIETQTSIEIETPEVYRINTEDDVTESQPEIEIKPEVINQRNRQNDEPLSLADDRAQSLPIVPGMTDGLNTDANLGQSDVDIKLGKGHGRSRQESVSESSTHSSLIPTVVEEESEGRITFIFLIFYIL